MKKQLSTPPVGTKIPKGRRGRLKFNINPIVIAIVAIVLVVFFAGMAFGNAGLNNTALAKASLLTCPNLDIRLDEANNDYYVTLPESVDWCYTIPENLSDTWKGIVESPVSLAKVSAMIAADNQDQGFVKKAMIESLQTGILILIK
ncbi:MAG: hypothetical protein WA052_00195 [Microgenomates group bacterium]